LDPVEVYESLPEVIVQVWHFKTQE
jgi:hypothetical protein